jgi:hypothetical protein
VAAQTGYRGFRTTSTRPKQRKNSHEINRSVYGHRDTRAGPVDISQSTKLTGAHYASCIQASHVARSIQVLHVTSCIQGIDVTCHIHVSNIGHLVGCDVFSRSAQRTD